MNINEVWNALDAGEDVYWIHEGYKVFIEPAREGCEYQAKHHTNRGGKILSIRFATTYWGSLMDEREMGNLFTKGTRK